MHELRYGALVTLVLVAAGCTRARPPLETSPEPVEAPAGPSASPQTGRNIWNFRPSATAVRRYLSEEKTIVELQSDLSPRRDSFAVSTIFTVQMLPATNGPRVAGTVESVTFHPERGADASDSLTVFPFSFGGRVFGGALVLDSLAGLPLTAFTNCGIGALNRISTVQRVLMTLPQTVTIGHGWADSSTVAACSGTIPVQLTTIRTYTVTGEARIGQRAAIAVERIDRVRGSGEGAQGQHRITLRVQGSGSARVYLDPETGLLLETDGKQRTEVAVGASGRIDRFVQTVEEHTQLH